MTLMQVIVLFQQVLSKKYNEMKKTLVLWYNQINKQISAGDVLQIQMFISYSRWGITIKMTRRHFSSDSRFIGQLDERLQNEFTKNLFQVIKSVQT